MAEVMNVYNVQNDQVVNIDYAKKVLDARLDPKLIKTRTVGNTKLDYIGGHTVIRLLNEAFMLKWSFEIVTEDIVPSQPKLNKYAKAGQDPLEAQPPVVKVLGRLTVPGYGIKEQYGSKVLIGGASEQEAAFKSASTDALKKCATLFGIGLELYDDDDAEQPGAPSQNTSSQSNKPSTSNKPSSAPTAPTASVAQWNSADINRLKELKTILGIEQTKNEQLDPYVREFLDNSKGTYLDISPTNIKAFNIYLTKKAETA